MKKSCFAIWIGILAMCAVFFAGCGAVSESGKDEEWHTYSTRFEEINMVTCPTFSFDYPENWSITAEEYDGQTNSLAGEYVVLSNGGNAEITFIRWSTSHIGGYGRTMYRYQVSKVSDSSFEPGRPAGTNTDLSGLGDFMVAKIETTGFMFLDTDSEYRTVEESYRYAVLPESRIGEYEARGLAGFYETFWVEYAGPFSIIAAGKDAPLTEKETEEVIKILASFRVE